MRIPNKKHIVCALLAFFFFLFLFGSSRVCAPVPPWRAKSVTSVGRKPPPRTTCVPRAPCPWTLEAGPYCPNLSSKSSLEGRACRRAQPDFCPAHHDLGLCPALDRWGHRWWWGLGPGGNRAGLGQFCGGLPHQCGRLGHKDGQGRRCILSQAACLTAR